MTRNAPGETDARRGKLLPPSACTRMHDGMSKSRNAMQSPYRSPPGWNPELTLLAGDTP